MSVVTLMDRDRALNAFQTTPALRDGRDWYGKAQYLLELLEVRGGKDVCAQDTDAGMLWLLVLRMRRYFLGLASLSRSTDDIRFTHAIDSYHAIHKSLFETYLEFSTCMVYLDQFGAGTKDPQGLTLQQRLRLHAEVTSLKKNREHHFRLDKWHETRARAEALGFQMEVPASIAAVMDAPREELKERLVSLVRRIQGPKSSIASYRHWFPEQVSPGHYFVAEGDDSAGRPKNCGSVEWLCKAVQATCSPDANLRQWWVTAYDNDYALINTYTHPAMGYDDCFRGTAERSLDLAQMQDAMRHMFHEVVLPPLKAYFRNVWIELLPVEERLRDLHLSIQKTVFPYLWVVHQQDRQTSPEGPHLWS